MDLMTICICFFAYMPPTGLSAVVQQIKGESARWANQVQLFNVNFTWAAGYYARSVDPDRVCIVARYIASQPDKHNQKVQWLYQYLQLIPTDKEISRVGIMFGPHLRITFLLNPS